MTNFSSRSVFLLSLRAFSAGIVSLTLLLVAIVPIFAGENSSRLADVADDVVEAQNRTDAVSYGGEFSSDNSIDKIIDQTATLPGTTWYWNSITADGKTFPLMGLDAAGRLGFFRANDAANPVIVIDPSGEYPAIWLGDKKISFENTSGVSFSTSEAAMAAAAATGTYSAGGGNASGNYSVAVGFGSASAGVCTTAVGKGAISSGDYSTAHGYNARAEGMCTTAMGDSARASGERSLAVGSWALASGAYSTAYGHLAKATHFGTAVGTGALASGDYSTAHGYLANATHFGTVALGENSYALAEKGIAIGRFSNASAYVAVALGNETSATAHAATAIGSHSLASGRYAISSGTWSGAEAENSIAIGHVAVARAYDANVIGLRSQALSPGAIVFGRDSIGSGIESIAIGNEVTIAQGAWGSVAIGLHTASKAHRQVSLGAFNNPDDPSGTLFTLGNGDSDNTRVNAVTVSKEGKTTLTRKNYTAPTLPVPANEALEVQGSARVRGVLFVHPAGDVEMGAFTSN
ncbi:MAG: hypothetical protein LBS59_02090 [Puniceicoccales bacterium]|nr:hypothetical protein [Puniceicoccales bacterium]